MNRRKQTNNSQRENHDVNERTNRKKRAPETVNPVTENPTKKTSPPKEISSHAAPRNEDFGMEGFSGNSEPSHHKPKRTVQPNIATNPSVNPLQRPSRHSFTARVMNTQIPENLPDGIRPEDLILPSYHSVVMASQGNTALSTASSSSQTSSKRVKHSDSEHSLRSEDTHKPKSNKLERGKRTTEKASSPQKTVETAATVTTQQRISKLRTQRPMATASSTEPDVLIVAEKEKSSGKDRKPAGLPKKTSPSREEYSEFYSDRPRGDRRFPMLDPQEDTDILVRENWSFVEGTDDHFTRRHAREKSATRTDKARSKGNRKERGTPDAPTQDNLTRNTANPDKKRKEKAVPEKKSPESDSTEKKQESPGHENLLTEQLRREQEQIRKELEWLRLEHARITRELEQVRKEREVTAPLPEDARVPKKTSPVKTPERPQPATSERAPIPAVNPTSPGSAPNPKRRKETPGTGKNNTPPSEKKNVVLTAPATATRPSQKTSAIRGKTESPSSPAKLSQPKDTSPEVFSPPVPLVPLGSTHPTSNFTGDFTQMKLSEEVIRALADAEYVQPSDIQNGFIPVALTGEDIMGQARTGTGKTAAFAIPILETLTFQDDCFDPQALILLPTRELAVQVRDEIQKLARYTDFETVALYGGKPIREQTDILRNGVDIVVGTPGRIMDHIQRGTLKLGRLKIVVLDEADRMLDIGFRPDIEKILRTCPQSRQTLLLSATIPGPVEHLARKYMRNPKMLNFSVSDIAADTIEQFYFTVDSTLKFELLKRLLEREQPRQAIIFCRTKRGTEKIYIRLSKLFKGVEHIHGDLQQRARDRVMKAFREGKVRFLVATDVVGRGIDVSGISHIINYDVPAFCDDYVHRVGRTGRMGRDGVAYTFVTPEEGNELTRIEIRINHLLKRDEMEGFRSAAVTIPETQPETSESQDIEGTSDTSGSNATSKSAAEHRQRRIRRAL